MRRLWQMVQIFVGVVLLLVLGVGGCLLYAFQIEPHRLAVHGETVGTLSLQSLRVVQFSDVHIKEDFTSEDLAKVVARINAQAPDVVVFTGDLYDNYALYHDDTAVAEVLATIEAKCAKLAVWGNRDLGGGASRVYEEVMTAAGFTVLRNETLMVDVGAGKRLAFTGLDDALLGAPMLPALPAADGVVLLSHEPDALANMDTAGYTLALSGHSHGGQVQLPFVSPLNARIMARTALSQIYSDGWYTLASGCRLYVNTGIGTTHVSARFGVVPEISVFDWYL